MNTNAEHAQEIEDINHLLLKGIGHERVTEHNVFALIRRAEMDNHPVLVEELREWRAD